MAPNQVRVGKDHESFLMCKFRTMRTGYEKISPDKEFLNRMFKSENDQRVTKFGKWLRETDLDELPQILNVLTGEMAFIGPRPFQPNEEKIYKSKNPSLRHLINYRTTVRPGMTGLWQVSGRNKTTLKQRLEFDQQYIDNLNPFLDLKIILLTIKLLISKK